MQHSPISTQASEEIDLRELIKALWYSRLTILLLTCMVTAIAAAYAFLSTPVYKTQVQTLPPTPNGLAEYNMAYQLSGPAIAILTGNKENTVPSNAVPSLEPKDAYAVFLRHIASVTLRQQFFETVYLPAQADYKETPASRAKQWEDFNNELTVRLPVQSEDKDLMVLTLQGTNPAQIADWANQYTEMAVTSSRKQLLATMKSAIDLRLQSTEKQIKVLRTNAKIEKEYRIAQLTEALAIAEATGLENPPNTGNLIATFKEETMYLRGTKALRAELEQLQNRDNDDPFIPKLSELLKIQTLLKTVDVEPKNLNVALVDEAASIPEDPIKPRKLLVIVLAFLFGLVISVFFVLIRYLFTYKQSVTAS